MITIVRAVRTCRACPAQWDAWDADGQYYYLRFRFGHGTVEAAASPEDYMTGTESRVVAEFEHGDGLLGEIELTEFAELAGLALAL